MNRIRIVELPKCRAVTSGYAIGETPFQEGGTLMRFMDWWSEYDKKRIDRWFGRSYVMYGREEQALIWFYAITDDEKPECEYEIVDFEGGLYAAAVAIDGNDEDEQRVYGEIKEWVKNSGAFDLDERPGHYDLCDVISPEYAGEAMGYMQLEIYVPIKLRTK